ncbi:hypothetical protein [Trueperella pyogenes]|uniref:hypothetical protein n=1 Tax=Trueperella pyogenes TaxID=1661 RepID=UPI00345DF410
MTRSTKIDIKSTVLPHHDTIDLDPDRVLILSAAQRVEFEHELTKAYRDEIQTVANARGIAGWFVGFEWAYNIKSSEDRRPAEGIEWEIADFAQIVQDITTGDLESGLEQTGGGWCSEILDKYSQLSEANEKAACEYAQTKLETTSPEPSMDFQKLYEDYLAALDD